jgi:hypothetical protein
MYMIGRSKGRGPRGKKRKEKNEGDKENKT